MPPTVLEFGSGRHPGAVFASCNRTGNSVVSEGLLRVAHPRRDQSESVQIQQPPTARSRGSFSAWRALLTASDPQFCGFQRFNPVSSGGHALSRIAPLDQRTALPDQCLHSAEADVRPPRRKSGFDPKQTRRLAVQPPRLKKDGFAFKFA